MRVYGTTNYINGLFISFEEQYSECGIYKLACVC